MLKVEDEYSTHEAMWHDRSHENQYPARHYSQPSIPTHTGHQPYMRVDPNFAASYAQPQWSLSQSGTNTPTPAYGSVDSYAQPTQYAVHHGFNFNQDPVSAVSMSPQSSQGGWASATSSDGVDQRFPLVSPTYRPVSPQLVLRPDGIRKKNARFEIPKERNLATIDALILSSTNEEEKKELKQQKRLLRNRQAAQVSPPVGLYRTIVLTDPTSLDSRQRKKTHTEKLEQEKKVHEKRMCDLEEGRAQIQEQLDIERQQWMHQRQHYEMQMRQIMHDRDEAIRAKTIEAADCRRQMNAMKEYIRDHQLERHSQRSSGYAPASDMNNFTSDFNDFNVDDDWETELGLFDNADFGTGELDSTQRQTTPKPPTSSIDKKTDAEFSWNTFYMCLLFGAVVVSAGGQLSKLATNSKEMPLPTVSDEYRVDAENVLKAVMSSNPQSAQEMIPARSATASVARATISGSELSQMTFTSRQQESGLDRLSSTLTTPSRHQQLQQAFAMTPASYNHIMDPLGELHDDDADADLPDSPKQSRLDQAMAAFQAKKSEVEKAGFPSRASERSAFNVPDSVMDDFRDFVRQSKQINTNHE